LKHQLDSISNATAVILAGGQATRMGKQCSNIPKSMLPLAGRPFLVMLVEFLVKNKLHIVIGTGNLADIIHEEFERAKWKPNVTCIKESSPLKTGGAVKFLANYVTTDDFILFNGDSILEVDVYKVIRFHRSHNYPVTQIVTKNSEQNEGAIWINATGLVVAFNEGKASNELPEIKEPVEHFSSTGCYVMDRSYVLQQFPDGPASLECDILPFVCSQGKVKAFKNPPSSLFFDFGTPDRYARATKLDDKVREIYNITNQA
jgi:mannose-1-phosphate guanylyltransferase